MSWKNLRQQTRSNNMHILPGTTGSTADQSKENMAFKQEDLELQWLSMCNRMPKQMSGIAARMKNMNPTILDMPAVEVVAPNEIVKTEVESIKGKIIATLRHYLRNADITLSIRVAEKQEQEKILTRRQQFELMVNENPAVEKLRLAFDLELA